MCILIYEEDRKRRTMLERTIMQYERKKEFAIKVKSFDDAQEAFLLAQQITLKLHLSVWKTDTDMGFFWPKN